MKDYKDLEKKSSVPQGGDNLNWGQKYAKPVRPQKRAMEVRRLVLRSLPSLKARISEAGRQYAPQKISKTFYMF